MYPRILFSDGSIVPEGDPVAENMSYSGETKSYSRKNRSFFVSYRRDFKMSFWVLSSGLQGAGVWCNTPEVPGTRLLPENRIFPPSVTDGDFKAGVMSAGDLRSVYPQEERNVMA